MDLTIWCCSLELFFAFRRNVFAPSHIESCDVGHFGNILNPDICDQNARRDIKARNRRAFGDVSDSDVGDLLATVEGEFRNVG